MKGQKWLILCIKKYRDILWYCDILWCFQMMQYIAFAIYCDKKRSALHETKQLTGRTCFICLPYDLRSFLKIFTSSTWKKIITLLPSSVLCSITPSGSAGSLRYPATSHFTQTRADISAALSWTDTSADIFAQIWKSQNLLTWLQCLHNIIWRECQRLPWW